jgi:hypothetical protein
MEKSKRLNLENRDNVKTSNHKGDPLKSDCSVSFPSLQPPPLLGYGRCLSKGYKVLIKRGVSRYKLFRYFVSKIVYDDEGLHLDEFLLLIELFYQFDESKDPNFQDNLNNLRNEGFKEFFEHLRKVKIFPFQPKDDTRLKFQVYTQSVIYDSRSFFRIKGQNRNKDFRLIFKDTILPRRTPPKPYIGIGYKDKGSRREPALDGSPKWQEVATYFANLEEGLENPRTSSDIESGEDT